MVAELRIVVPTGVGVATCANASPVVTDSSSTANSRRVDQLTFPCPIDAPRAGRLFTAPPASCVGTSRNRLCIGSHLLMFRRSAHRQLMVTRKVMSADPPLGIDGTVTSTPLTVGLPFAWAPSESPEVSVTEAPLRVIELATYVTF